MPRFVQQAHRMKSFAQLSAARDDDDLIWYTDWNGYCLLYEETRSPEDPQIPRPLRFIKEAKLLGITLHVTPISGSGLTLVDLKEQSVLSSCSEHFLTDTPS